MRAPRFAPLPYPLRPAILVLRAISAALIKPPQRVCFVAHLRRPQALNFATARGNFLAIATSLLGDKAVAIEKLESIQVGSATAWSTYDLCFNSREADFNKAIGAVEGTLQKQNVHKDWSDIHFIQCALELLATDQHA